MESHPAPAMLHVTPERPALLQTLRAGVEEQDHVAVAEKGIVELAPVRGRLVGKAELPAEVREPLIRLLDKADVREVVLSGVERDDPELRRLGHGMRREPKEQERESHAAHRGQRIRARASSTTAFRRRSLPQPFDSPTAVGNAETNPSAATTMTEAPDRAGDPAKPKIGASGACATGTRQSTQAPLRSSATSEASCRM